MRLLKIGGDKIDVEHCKIYDDFDIPTLEEILELGQVNYSETKAVEDLIDLIKDEMHIAIAKFNHARGSYKPELSDWILDRTEDKLFAVKSMYWKVHMKRKGQNKPILSVENKYPNCSDVVVFYRSNFSVEFDVIGKKLLVVSGKRKFICDNI